MKNLAGVVDLYCEFLLDPQEHELNPKIAVKKLADMALSYWHFLLFTPEEDVNLDDATKAEEILMDFIETDFTDEEKQAFQEAAQRQLDQKFPGQETIDPEDESHDREQRFLTFIAIRRMEDMYLL